MIINTVNGIYYKIVFLPTFFIVYEMMYVIAKCLLTFSTYLTYEYMKHFQIRFFYHKYGLHSSSLALYVVQMERHGNQTNILWWSYGKGNKIWESVVIALPDIRYR